MGEVHTISDRVSGDKFLPMEEFHKIPYNESPKGYLGIRVLIV